MSEFTKDECLKLIEDKPLVWVADHYSREIRKSDFYKNKFIESKQTALVLARAVIRDSNKYSCEYCEIWNYFEEKLEHKPDCPVNLADEVIKNEANKES